MAIFTAGTRLNKGKYEILRLLGAGGFGITYLAQNKTGEKVVLKFLNVQELVSKGKASTFGERQSTFINEAITLALVDLMNYCRLTHPTGLFQLKRCNRKLL